MTAKEALKYIETDIRYHNPTCAEDASKAKEAELCLEYTLDYINDLEKLVSSTLRMNKVACKRLLELEKVLKIIKEKSVDVLSILNGACETVEEYNRHHSYIDDVRNGVKPLTETEFNLLKEVLK